MPYGVASAHVCGADTAKETGTDSSPMGQEEEHVWCHPITTQADAEITHSKCVRVYAEMENKRANSGECINIKGWKDEPLASLNSKHLILYYRMWVC